MMAGPEILWALDAGNSAVKLGRFEDGQLARVYIWPREAWTEYQAVWRDRFEKAESEANGRVTGAICSAGRSSDEEPLGGLLTALGAENVRFVSMDGPLPFSVVYTEGRPGADRLANAAGLRALALGRAAVAVDFGTAIHTAVINGAGEFMGGVILPGLWLQARSLPEATAGRLPLVEPESADDAPTALASSTIEAIRGGILLGAAGAVDRLVRESGAQCGGAVPAVFLTGGGAPLISPLLATTHTILPHLTLIGLREIWLAAGRSTA